jgi:hypothetical protein
MIARPKKKVQTFHAMMFVTRMEEWCVDAASAEEAKTLLAAGEGHRCHLGETIHVDLHGILDER